MKIVASILPAALAILFTAAPAQESLATRADSLLATRVTFARSLDIYAWRLHAAYTHRINPQTTFRFGENFLTSLHRLPGNDRWKDDQDASIRLDFRALGAPAEAQLFSRVFRDPISLFNSDQQNSGAQVRWRERLWNRLEIRPGVGYRWESRLDQPDRGPHFEFEARLPESQFGGYSHQLDATGAIDRFPSRKNEDLRFNYGLSRQFYEDTSDSLFLNYAHYRRDTFVSYGSELEKIYVERHSRRTRGLENRLRYRLSGSGRLALRSLIQESVVSINYQQLENVADESDKNAYEEFNVQHVLSLNWRWQKFATGFEFRFEQQTFEKNKPAVALPFPSRFSFRRPDFHAEVFAISQRSSWQPSTRDSLSFSGSVERFARDTEAADSYDNFRARLSLTHQHNFRRGFAVRWQLSGYADHLVYLKSAFSATNNWTRILQFSPQVLFKASEAVQASQRVGVRAHYVTYDFEDIPGTPKSFSSRTFFVNDSLTARLTSHTTMAVNYNLELEEIGSLNWKEFTTRPQVTRIRHWVLLTFDYAVASRWRFSPGASLYQQTQWLHEATPRGIEQRRAGRLTTLGPQVRLTYERAPRALLYFQGQQQMVFSDGAKRQTQYYFNLTVQWSL